MIVGKQTTSARVDAVQPGSAAATAGFKPGDVVLSIDKEKIESFADMQRIDLGIALCHWELSAGERNLEGHWQRSDPGLALPDEHTEYGVTWVAGA